METRPLAAWSGLGKMRYYDITITPQQTPTIGQKRLDLERGKQSAATIANGNSAATLRYSSLDNPTNAMQVNIDIPVAPQHIIAGQGYIRVFGVPITLINQASQYYGAKVEVRAGMSRGLPLANQQQSGIIATGAVVQAVGDWEGGQIYLDFFLVASMGIDVAPYVVDVKAGASLDDALRQTLSAALPDLTIVMNASQLISNYAQTAVYGSLTQVSKFAKNFSHDINQVENYNGLSITVQNGKVIVDDGTKTTASKIIKFVELIGKPTWINGGEVQFRTVMRGDISIYDFVKFEPNQVMLETAQSYANLRNISNFSSTYQIIQIRHLGNNRQQGGDNWVSIFNCVPQQSWVNYG